jgi:hypothetical protein
MNSPTPSNPLHHVNEWDDIVTEPLQGGQAGVGVPQVRCQGNPGLLQGRGSAQRARTEAVLPGSGRRVLPGAAGVVSGRSMLANRHGPRPALSLMYS